MKNFITVFKFTCYQNLKSKPFIIMTIAGILITGIFSNINNIKQVFFDDSKKIIAFSDADNKLMLTEDGLNKYLSDKYIYKIIDSKEQVDKIKENINKDSSDYFGLVTIKANKVDEVEIYVKYITDPQPIDQINNYIQNMFFSQKASKMKLDTKEYNNLVKSVPFNIIQQNIKVKDNIVLIYVMIMVLYIMIMYYGSVVANSVIEEKNNRIMETLITIAKPTELFFGKVFAICTIGLSQFLTFILATCIFLKLNNTNISSIGGLNIVVSKYMLVYLVIFLILGYLLYSFVYGAMGSLVSSAQDTTQAMLPMTALIMIIFMIAMTSLESPDSIMIKVLSYVPFSSPIIMFERIGLTTVKWYEISISLAILIVTILFVGVLSSKVYKKGVLHYGKRMSLFKVFKQGNKKVGM